MMKAAQASGGSNNNGTPGGHSGLLGASANLSSTSPGPQGQNMMQGKSLDSYQTAHFSENQPKNPAWFMARCFRLLFTFYVTLVTFMRRKRGNSCNIGHFRSIRLRIEIERSNRKLEVSSSLPQSNHSSH